MEEFTNFNYRPKLRQMLVDYVYRTYEENSIIDDEHLIMEYNYLKKHNKLHLLFDEEYLINWLNDGTEYSG
jgi:hypothetical protein